MSHEIPSPVLCLSCTVWNKIQSTKNLSKITSSMKMVSAAKLKGDETRLKGADAFNAWTTPLCAGPTLVDGATFEELPKKVLIVSFSSDKGLCGGVNSYISRAVRNCAAQLAAQGKECDLAVVGDKGRAQLKRTHGEKIIRSMTDVISPGTFFLASSLASELIEAGATTEYDGVVLIYNKFINAATYNSMYKVITPFVIEAEEGNETMPAVEFDSDSTKTEVMEDMYEYLLASQIFHSFMDGAASEQSSRMTAMENASKNANEMIDALTLKYNRVRQTRITTELIEIISGAAALDDK